MNIRLLTTGTVLFCAALLNAQSEPKTSEDAASKEAQRQARVALQPNAQQSPSQTIKQAIAFERYKERAADRESQKENSVARSENRTAKVKHTAHQGKQK
jgi:hypothetical protein